MSEITKMLAGEPYFSSDKELVQRRYAARDKLNEINAIPQRQVKQKASLFKKLFGTTGKRVFIEPVFQCDYGFNIHVGENFYANFNCVMLDGAKISIGDNCMLGPMVSIFATTHPIEPTKRNKGIEYSIPVSMGNNCWVGGQAVINPGVVLGDNVVVASGSVVTNSFGDNVVIGGNPARIIKRVNNE